MRLFPSVFAFCLLSACGVSRRYVIESSPQDTASMMEAIHEAALARGLEPRYNEEEEVRFHLDRDMGTWLAFQAQGNGVVLVVTTSEDLPPNEQEAEFARGEAFGESLMQEARGLEVVLQQRRREEAMADAAQERQDEIDNAAQRAQLQAFMNGNAARNDAFQSRNAAPSAGGGGGSNPGAAGGSGGSGQSAHCCINGAYYSCPSLAAVDQCSGAFMRCLNGCGMSMSCVEQCSASDPPDPSACSREASRDSEC